MIGCADGKRGDLSSKADEIRSKECTEGTHEGLLVHLLARSAVVSVAVLKAGGKLFYPIGRTRGKATNFLLLL